MSRFAASKYKNTAGKEAKREQWYSELTFGGSNADGTPVAVSATLIAYAMHSTGGGNVGILCLDQVGKQRGTAHLAAHSGPISDLAFCNFDYDGDYLLATASDDSLVRVWRIPQGGLPANQAEPVRTLAGHARKVEAVCWNPSAAWVLASAAGNSVIVWDAEKGAPTATIHHPDSIQGLAWSPDGALLATTCKDKILRIIDARSGSILQDGCGHEGGKGSRVTWLGAHGKLLTTGFDKMREREGFIIDAKDISKPLSTICLGSGTGLLVPHYDYDTSLVFLTAKGESAILVLEVNSKAAPFFTAGLPFSASRAHCGACLYPKRVLDVMHCEVSRLALVAGDSIIPVSMTVPRKNMLEFAADLFPDTGGVVPGCTPTEWLAGSTAQPPRVSLDPALTTPPGAPVSVTLSAAPATTTPVVAPTLVNAAAPRSAPAAKHVSVVRSSKFRHVAGVSKHKNYNIEDVANVYMALPGESNVLAANRKYVAYPVAGSGGQIAIVQRAVWPAGGVPSQPMRLPDRPPGVMNSSAVMDFSFCPCDDSLLAAGCENGHVRIWRIPEGGLAETVEQPWRELKGHHMKCNIVRFHPLSANVLVSASFDNTLRVWDIESGEARVTVQLPEQALALGFSTDGTLLAVLCKDKNLHLYDARSGELLKTAPGHAGARGGRVLFMGDTGRILTTGFDRSSKRELHVYETATLQLLATHELDVSPAILDVYYDQSTGLAYLSAKGDTSVKIFECSNEAPCLFPLDPFTSTSTQQGVVFLPKTECDVANIEIALALKLTQKNVEVVSFTVPRTKKQYFQDDLFPPVRATWEPTLTANEFFAGETKAPRLVDLRPEGMQPVSEAPAADPTGRDDQRPPSGTGQAELDKKDALMTRMVELAANSGDRPMEQDLMEGADDDEWDD